MKKCTACGLIQDNDRAVCDICLSRLEEIKEQEEKDQAESHSKSEGKLQSFNGKTKCPFCAEEIQNEAVKCKHCGEFLCKKPSDQNQGTKQKVKGKASNIIAYIFNALQIVIIIGGIYAGGAPVRIAFNNMPSIIQSITFLIGINILGIGALSLGLFVSLHHKNKAGNINIVIAIAAILFLSIASTSKILYEQSVTSFIISAIITWGIGLTPPLLIRFVFLRRHMSKGWAFSTVILFGLINFVIFFANAAARGDNRIGGAFILIAFASYAILRKSR